MLNMSKTQAIDPMLDQCWTTVYDAGLTLTQQYANVSCLFVYIELLAMYWHSTRTQSYPRKHETLKQCWINVVPASATLAQHEPNIVQMSRVCWDVTEWFVTGEHLFFRKWNELGFGHI